MSTLPPIEGDLLTKGDLEKLVAGIELPDGLVLTAHQQRWIASAIWHRVHGYANYRYSLGFRAGIDHERRESEYARLAAEQEAAEAADVPEQLDLLGGAA